MFDAVLASVSNISVITEFEVIASKVRGVTNSIAFLVI
jgi:hypothetical protein